MYKVIKLTRANFLFPDSYLTIAKKEGFIGSSQMFLCLNFKEVEEIYWSCNSLSMSAYACVLVLHIVKNGYR